MAIINEKTGSVKLVKGKATIRYKLTEPLPVVNNLVKCTVNAPIGTAKTLRVPRIVIPEVFVLSLKRISDSVVVTITSTIPNSTTSLSINIDESRDGSPNRVPIGNVTHPVTLVNGVGTLTYAIRQPNPTTAGRVSVKIINTNPLVTKSVNVAAYVPPEPPWNPQMTFTWGSNGSTLKSGSTTLTLAYSNSDGRSDSGTFDLSALYQSLTGQTMGVVSFTPNNVSLSPGQSRTITVNWSRNNTNADATEGTLSFFCWGKFPNDHNSIAMDFVKYPRFSINHS